MFFIHIFDMYRILSQREDHQIILIGCKTSLQQMSPNKDPKRIYSSDKNHHKKYCYKRWLVKWVVSGRFFRIVNSNSFHFGNEWVHVQQNWAMVNVWHSVLSICLNDLAENVEMRFLLKFRMTSPVNFNIKLAHNTKKKLA